MKMRWLLGLGVVGASFSFGPGVARAVISHPQDDAFVGSMPTPPPAAIGQWNVDGLANASAVAIGPNHILTTRHQGGGVGSIVRFGGTRYAVAQETLVDATADLRVLRITQENSAAPADLADFTPLFTGSDAAPPGYTFTLGGFGRPRGATLLDAAPSNEPYGYQWTFDIDNDPQTPDSVNQTTLRFGRNQVDGINTLVSPYPFPSEVLRADFDGPGAATAVEGEAILTEFDSGSGWFVETSPGVWRVVALSTAVDHVGLNNNQPSDRSLYAAFSDADTPEPDLLFGVRLSAYAANINAAVPEPASLTLLAAGAALVGMRRRR